MPPEDRAARNPDRCELHPGRPAVARCAACERPLCVRCAVPVRGRVLGPECLREALGDEAPEPQPVRVPPWRRRAPADFAIGACFAVATVLTFVPWTRFGSGSGFAGAWAADPRWSMLAALAAPAGLAVWVFARRIGRAAAPIEAVLGALLVVSAVMAFRNPPSYKRPSVAPLLMMATGGLAAALALVHRHPLAYEREPTGGTP